MASAKMVLKTSGMKLSEIRPCDNCGGVIAPTFRIATIKTAIFNPQNTNSVLGTLQILGNRSLAIAEAMASGTDRAIEVLDEPEQVHTLFICNQCLMADLCLGELIERRNKAVKDKEEKS